MPTPYLFSTAAQKAKESFTKVLAGDRPSPAAPYQEPKYKPTQREERPFLSSVEDLFQVVKPEVKVKEKSLFDYTEEDFKRSGPTKAQAALGKYFDLQKTGVKPPVPLVTSRPAIPQAGVKPEVGRHIEPPPEPVPPPPKDESVFAGEITQGVKLGKLEGRGFLSKQLQPEKTRVFEERELAKKMAREQGLLPKALPGEEFKVGMQTFAREFEKTLTLGYTDIVPEPGLAVPGQDVVGLTGTALGFVAPISAINKVVAPLKLFGLAAKSPVMARIVKNGLDFGLYELARNPEEGESRMFNAAYGFAWGMGLGSAWEVAKPAYQMLSKSIGRITEPIFFKNKWITPEEMWLASSEITSGVERGVSKEALAVARDIIKNSESGGGILKQIKEGANFKQRRDWVQWVRDLLKYVPENSVPKEAKALLAEINQAAPSELGNYFERSLQVFGMADDPIFGKLLALKPPELPTTQVPGKFAQLAKDGKFFEKPVIKMTKKEQLDYAKTVLTRNDFTIQQIDYYTGKKVPLKGSPHGLSAEIWQQASKEVGFTKDNLEEYNGKFYLVTDKFVSDKIERALHKEYEMLQAEDRLNLFDNDTINLFNRVKAVSRGKKVAEGDIEFFRKTKHGTLIEKAVEVFRESSEEFASFTDEEAYNAILNLPTKTELKSLNREAAEAFSKVPKLFTKEAKAELAKSLEKEVIKIRKLATGPRLLPEPKMTVKAAQERIQTRRRETKAAFGEWWSSAKSAWAAADPKVKKLPKGTKAIKLYDDLAKTRETIYINRAGVPVSTDWFKHTEKIHKSGKDIPSPLVTKRHVLLTPERVAEHIDGKLLGPTYKKIVKPVWDSAKQGRTLMKKWSQQIEGFKVLEGSKADRAARFLAENKPFNPKELTKGARGLARFSRNWYDKLFKQLNKMRIEVGMEPFPFRKDYVTQLQEISILAELFGGLNQVSRQRRIDHIANELVSQGVSEERAFIRAKRKVDGMKGLEVYIDPKSPAFINAKERLKAEGAQSLINSLKAYMQHAGRFMAHYKNVAKVKAHAEYLPPNAKAYFRNWAIENVGGFSQDLKLNPVIKRGIGKARNFVGQNLILYNAGVHLLQLTSWPQVVSSAGLGNTLYGITKAMAALISPNSLYKTSRTGIMRNVMIDVGFGDSLLDSALHFMNKAEVLKNPTARARAGIEAGRRLGGWILMQFDTFTVAGTWEAFYRQATKELGLGLEEAMEWADLWAGKTQGNYFAEGMGPWLDTLQGKVALQFNLYGANLLSWIRRDMGRRGIKGAKKTRSMLKAAMVFLMGAFVIDVISDETFGRTPFEIKPLLKELDKARKGDQNEAFSQVFETAFNFVPGLGSVKFGPPPVPSVGIDMAKALVGSDSEKREARKSLLTKDPYMLLTPYGGNQLRKTLEGYAANYGLDVPFVKQVKFTPDTPWEKFKALILGPWATTTGREVLEGKEDEWDIDWPGAGGGGGDDWDELKWPGT